jgi:hypothetical protein
MGAGNLSLIAQLKVLADTAGIEEFRAAVSQIPGAFDAQVIQMQSRVAALKTEVAGLETQIAELKSVAPEALGTVTVGSQEATTAVDKLRAQAEAAQERLQTLQMNPELVAQIQASNAALREFNLSGKESTTTIQGMFPTLTSLRQLVRLAFGVTALVYFAENIEKIIAGIQSAADALGGFSAALKGVMTDAEADDLKILSRTRQNNKEIFAEIEKMTGAKNIQLAIDKGDEEQLKKNQAEIDKWITKETKRLDLRKQYDALNLTSLQESLALVGRHLVPLEGQVEAVVRVAQAHKLANEAAAEGLELTKSAVDQENLLNKLKDAQAALEDAIYGKKIAAKKTEQGGQGRAKEIDESAAILIQQDAELEKIRQTIAELTSGELPARQRITIAIQDQIIAQDQSLARDRELLLHKKITADEYAQIERNHDVIVAGLREELDIRLQQADQKELEAETRQAEHRQKLYEAEVARLAKLAREEDVRLAAYVARLQKESAVDMAHAREIQSTSLQAIRIKTEEKVAIIQAMSQIEAQYALAIGNIQRYAEITFNTQKAITAAWALEGAEVTKDANKIMAVLKQKEQQELESYNRIRSPGAQYLAQLRNELLSVQRHTQEVIKAAAAARTEATALLQEAQNKRALAAVTADLTQKTILLTQAKQQETQATNMQTEADKAETDSKIKEILADAEAVANAASNLLTTLGLRKEAAYVEMVMQTAAGYGSLADHDYWAAAEHFLSAAEYGIIAGQSSDKASGGSGGSGGSSASSSGTSTTTAPVTPPVLAPGVANLQKEAIADKVQQPTVIHMEIHVPVQVTGPVYGGQSGLNELAEKIAKPVNDKINYGVTNLDWKSFASHSINPSPVSRGRS